MVHAMIERTRLAGRWVHSHEEDTVAEIVFRSANSGYAFPPSRGREALNLHADGSWEGTVPGPTDKPEPTGGGTSGRTLEVTAVDGNVLRVRK